MQNAYKDSKDLMAWDHLTDSELKKSSNDSQKGRKQNFGKDSINLNDKEGEWKAYAIIRENSSTWRTQKLSKILLHKGKKTQVIIFTRGN